MGGTEIATPAGPVPIESIEPGDEVITLDQLHPESAPTTGRVTRIFRRVAPVVLWLTLSNGQVMGTTPGHRVWRYENGWGWAGALKQTDALMDPNGEPVEAVDVLVDLTPTVVYNLEVDGTFTYFAQGVWVHNNSCRINSFSIWDWKGYPAGVRKPAGPFVLIEGAHYDTARAAANRATDAYRRAKGGYTGKQVHHVHPVKFGGDPSDWNNLEAVDLGTHTELNNFWRRVQSNVEGRQ